MEKVYKNGSGFNVLSKTRKEAQESLVINIQFKPYIGRMEWPERSCIEYIHSLNSS